jgi:hypothetical protein
MFACLISWDLFSIPFMSKNGEGCFRLTLVGGLKFSGRPFHGSDIDAL